MIVILMSACSSYHHAQKQTNIHNGPNNLAEDTTSIQVTSDKRILNERGSVYSVSGIGLGFTGGETGDLLKPGFSTNLGLDISLGAGSFFLYPSADLLTFRYDQQIADNNYLYSAQKSRASYKIFTLAFGYRKSVGKLRIYQFAGFGGGVVAEPRISVREDSQEAVLHNKKSSTWSAKGGLGFDYQIGQFVVFAEGTHLHNFKSLQDRKILVFPVYIGLKSNISSLFKPVKTK
ncbi:hypothetical protein [Desertivirga xinjiangensis]|uniref:hypothetical protein n=1 Tax=Desertivirga xinjiangensis TaxID=539206 RepID=UPI00210F1530|nr:hypothetical protein [Pedobacter xinjiangensis]